MEIEAKIAVDSHDHVRAALRRAGGESKAARLETNIFLDTPEQRLEKADRGLRVRIARRLDDGSSKVILTVKGPQQKGKFKSRDEFEIEVADADEALRFFGALGFARTVSFEKRRESWELGGCKIELDELPMLGRFVEIEGPDEQTISGVCDQLGLSGRPPIHTSYIAMLIGELKRENKSSTEIRF